jgi:hypothetical protein
MSFGPLDVVDLGGISTARATEMMVKIRLLVMTSLDTPIFNFKTSPPRSTRPTTSPTCESGCGNTRPTTSRRTAGWVPRRSDRCAVKSRRNAAATHAGHADDEFGSSDARRGCLK